MKYTNNIHVKRNNEFHRYYWYTSNRSMLLFNAPYLKQQHIPAIFHIRLLFFIAIDEGHLVRKRVIAYPAIVCSQYYFLFAITAGVVPCGGPKKSPRTSSLY